MASQEPSPSRRRIVLGAAGGALLAASRRVPAQAGRAFRLVVPFSPGGGQDILARGINTELGALLGETVVIDYRPGAGGAIGSAYVARAEPDGRTLLVGAAGHTIAALLTSKPAYHPVRDFAAVAHIGIGSQVILVGAALPVRTLAEFVAYAKARPGQLNFGSAGTGSSTHLSMAYFASVAGLELVHVPYKSNSEPVNELIAGRLHVVSVPSISAIGYVSDPRLRLLAGSGRARSPFFPDLPAVAETYPGYGYESWFGLLAPAGTPRAAIERINDAMVRLLATPAVRERLLKLAIEPRPLSPDEFTRVLEADYERLAAIVKTAGARSE